MPCDINFSQVTTPDRDKVLDFTEPYFDANQGVPARTGITVVGQFKTGEVCGAVVN